MFSIANTSVFSEDFTVEKLYCMTEAEMAIMKSGAKTIEDAVRKARADSTGPKACKFDHTVYGDSYVVCAHLKKDLEERGFTIDHHPIPDQFIVSWPTPRFVLKRRLLGEKNYLFAPAPHHRENDQGVHDKVAEFVRDVPFGFPEGDRTSLFGAPSRDRFDCNCSLCFGGNMQCNCTRAKSNNVSFGKVLFDQNKN